MPRFIPPGEFMMILVIACLLVSLSTTPTQAPANNQSAIRKVDFNNFTFVPECAGENVRVTKGEYSREKSDDPLYFKVMNVVYGDLNGDGIEEAVVTTLCNTGGTGQFTDGIIFTMQKGRPTPVVSLGMGDRADGGIHEVRIENGVLKVSRYGGNSGACCPDYIDIHSYKLTGSKLVQTGKPVRGDFADKYNDRTVRRVQFKKGTTTTTLTGTTSGADEYLLGARAGQTMIVLINGKNLSLELRSPDGADLPQPVPNKYLTVKLPASGDYRFVINAAQGKVDYSLEVTIR